jgi:hypothetical protein
VEYKIWKADPTIEFSLFQVTRVSDQRVFYSLRTADFEQFKLFWKDIVTIPFKHLKPQLFKIIFKNSVFTSKKRKMNGLVLFEKYLL